MIFYKTNEEIQKVKESSLMVSATLAEIAKVIEIGMTTKEIDNIAYKYILSINAVPAFLNYNGFPNTLCISVNSQVVHGIPSSYKIKDGDIVSIDCGVKYNDFYGDSCFSFGMGALTEVNKNLLKVTKQSLYEGISAAKVGCRIGDISYAIQNYAEINGYSVVRELVGHGIGKKLHESPEVPNFGKRGNGPLIKEGLVIAIEPMINMGKRDVYQWNDGWTVSTKDGLPSAHFEHTIAIRSEGVEILSSFVEIEEILKNRNIYYGETTIY